MKNGGNEVASGAKPGYLRGRPGYVLKVVERLQRREMDHALSKIRRTMAQYAALSVLADHAGVSNAELARRRFVTAQTMTGILRALHRDGRVTRTPTPRSWADHPVSAHQGWRAAACARRHRDHGDRSIERCRLPRRYGTIVPWDNRAITTAQSGPLQGTTRQGGAAT